MSKATYTAEVLQFMLPHGRQNPTSTELPIETREAYQEMMASGCRFEAEMLMTGQVSVTISNPKDEEDLDFSITRNGPEVQAGMIAMLQRRRWVKLTA